MPNKRGHFPKHQNIDTVNYLKKYRLACRKPCLSTLLALISIIKFLLSFSNQHQITHINWHKKDHKENQAVGISTIGTQWDQIQTGKMAPYMKGVLKKFVFLFYLVGLHRMTTQTDDQKENPNLQWSMPSHCPRDESCTTTATIRSPSWTALQGYLVHWPAPWQKSLDFLASDFALPPTFHSQLNLPLKE